MGYIKSGLIILSILLFSIGYWTASARAVEPAPRITDREIIESLATLKEGQAALNRRLDDFIRGVDKRFEDMNQRFEDMTGSIEGLRNTMLVLFGSIVTLIVALFGYIAWDRKTSLRPLQERLDRLEYDLHRDLELQHEDGSKLTRLIKVLRQMAKTDQKLADVLRSFSLM